jgi:HemX protein
MIGFLHLGSFALYGLAGALLGVSLAREARRLTAIASILVAIGLVVHGVGLAEYTTEWDQLPIIGLGPVLSTLGFLTGLGFLMASTLGHASTVGIILVPLVALLTAVAAMVGIAPVPFGSGWFIVHILFALVGYVGFAVSFAAGLMYLIQFRELKSKHFGAIFRFFPPLDTLDRLNRRGLLIGLPFLTSALILGWGWMSSTVGSPDPGSPKLVWVMVSWGVIAAALLARLGGGRKAERGAIATVLGFVVVVGLYVVIHALAAEQGAFL